MDRTRYLDELAATVDRSGWALQAVRGAAYPASVEFVYTVGNTAVGLPELIAMGLPLPALGWVVNQVNALVRDRVVAPEPGTEIPGQLLGLDPSVSLRLGAVAERWAAHYGVMAHELYLRESEHQHGLRFLQLVVPDPDGRLWDDPDYDRLSMDPYQPDLSHDRHPWRSPYMAPTSDLFLPEPGQTTVALPVLEPHDGDLGRRELVPAVPLDDDVYQLVAPPVLADWVTAGAEVHAPGGELVEAFVVRSTQIYERVVRPSPLVHLVWLMHVHDLQTYEDLMDRLDPELDLPGTAWLETGQSLHVATPQRFAAQLRSRLRHLVRDGLLLERELYHRAVEPDVSCGPWCAGYDDLRGDGPGR